MKSKAQPTATSSTMDQTLRILTVRQVADLLQIPTSSVYEKTRHRPNSAPPLPCRRVGKYLRFFEHEVMAWLVALPQSSSQRRRAA